MEKCIPKPDSRSEKIGLLSDAEEHQNPSPTRSKPHHRRAGVMVAIVLFGWWTIVSILPSIFGLKSDTGYPGHMYDDEQYTFEAITPSANLDWHPCFTTLFCARLSVPMDYHRPLNESEENPKVHVALLLVPGKHSGPHKFSTSPLLLNPGGPGGSGVSIALAWGDHIQKIIGEDQDVIGFDPRGISFTTPPADCYSYPAESNSSNISDYYSEDYTRGNSHRFLWTTSGKEAGNVISNSDTLHKLDVRARTVAKLCKEKDSQNGKDSILKYVNTPNVARDMLSIIDAWDAWTETIKDGEVIETKNTARPSKDSYSLETKGKLVYWGFSYGTLLGATFASMFPDRVGRLVLDGVVDADHYVSPMWTGSIDHADYILSTFSRYCQEGGDMCALYREGDTAADVEIRFQRILRAIKEYPVTLIHPISRAPIVVTYSDIRLLLFTTLYSPAQMFPAIGQIFDLLHRGHEEILGQIWSLPYDHEPFCSPELPSYMFMNEAQNAIMCSDKRYPLNETLPALEQRYEKMLNTSSFADVWMSLMVGCDSWAITPIDPPMRWDNHPAHQQKPINTSFPLLFVGNSYDPVTPLKAAIKMANKFVDAGLIEQKSEGHCSIAVVSLCTIKKIRAYFTKGEVPSPLRSTKSANRWADGNWEQCEADEWPFHPFDGEIILATSDAEAQANVESLNALKEMQESYFQRMDFWKSRNVLDLSLVEHVYASYGG